MEFPSKKTISKYAQRLSAAAFVAHAANFMHDAHEKAVSMREKKPPVTYESEKSNTPKYFTEGGVTYRVDTGDVVHDQNIKTGNLTASKIPTIEPPVVSVAEVENTKKIGTPLSSKSEMLDESKTFETIPELYAGIVHLEAVRLGLDEQEFFDSVDAWLNFVADTESRMQAHAANLQGSSARGFMQILTKDYTLNDEGKSNYDGSIHVRINRLNHLLDRYSNLATPTKESLAWTQALYEHPETIEQYSLEQQKILVFANTVQMRGSDEYLPLLLSKDRHTKREAWLESYYRFHHTNPDLKSIKNAELMITKHLGSHAGEQKMASINK